MVLGFDDATPVNTNAQTEVQLNGGVSLTAPDKANTLVECVPYGTYQATITTDEPQVTQIRLQSDDIAIEPKRFNMPSVQPVPALAGWFGSPALTAYSMNVDLSTARSARINYFADQLLALTNEPAIGVTVVYDDSGAGGLEQFWQSGTGVPTATALTIDTATAGADITITGGREINKLTCNMQIGTTSTASQNLWGRFDFSSSDFLTSMPFRVSAQPITVGIGATGDLAIANQGGLGINIWNCNIPIAGRTVINTSFVQRDALTVAGSFVHGVGYLK